jgi:tetratricopeptide (TPR) repeat protein
MTSDEKINVAHAALLQGDYAHSEQLYREVLIAEPENVRALDGLGILHCQKGETEAGIALFTTALHLLCQESQPNSQWEASLLFHLGLSYRTLGQQQEALRVFTDAAAVHAPHEFDLVLNLGQVHFELEQYEPAAECFKELTTLKPDDASAWLTLGFILSNLDRHHEASAALRTAELLDTTSPDICFYLAESLRKDERYEESLPHYQRMLQVGAEYPQAVHGYGKSLLALGNLEDGWDAMEFRFAAAIGSWERHNLTNWSPDTNTATHVLAYSEEGIGAELMFASCLPDIINSVDHCVVECESSLHSLFKRSFPRADFVPLADDYVRSEGNPWNIPLDAQIAFGSLPRHFRRNMDDFPLRKAYLVPDRELVSQWSTRLASLGDAKKVGILWSGTWTDETAKQRSLPIQELRTMMDRHQGAAWICLQNGNEQRMFNEPRMRMFNEPRMSKSGAAITFSRDPRSLTFAARECGAARSGGASLHIFPEAFKYDLDMMAALLTALDLVITPPGYVAHLAGALGVRTWLLLPAVADWRHSIDVAAGSRSVWHPTIKMYRQAKEQTWQHFFAMLENDLEQFLTTHRPPEEMPVTLKFTERKTITPAKEVQPKVA